MKDDGGPAFPVPMNIESWGISLRDYFAAMALQGAIAATAHPNAMGWPTVDRVLTQYCYEVADAMLAERSKGE